VQIEITDVDGRAHCLEEKSAVIDTAVLLHADTPYPVEIQIARLPRHQEYRPGEFWTVRVINLSPRGVGDPAPLYPLQGDQLSWASPAVCSDLSVCARQAVAPVTFHAWRESVRLDGEGRTTLEDHRWQFVGVTPETFSVWHGSHPVIRLGQDDPLPAGVRDSVALCGLGRDDVAARGRRAHRHHLRDEGVQRPQQATIHGHMQDPRMRFSNTCPNTQRKKR
jgi:hypothetical protein